MRNSLVRTSFLAAIVLLQGCRIGAAVFEGGDVVSESGTRHCYEGRTCEFQVNDTNFSETFTATPRAGYEFVRWRGGEDHLCPDSTDPICVVSNIGSAGNPAIEAIVASDRMYYLVPEFKCVLDDCPRILLDSVLLVLEDQSKLVEAYVATNGGYPVDLASFGLNTTYQPPPSLFKYINPHYYGQWASDGTIIRLVAAVYRSLWDGSGVSDTVGFFHLSGSTNGDNSWSWDCVPGDGRGGWSVPLAYLPTECRGN